MTGRPLRLTPAQRRAIAVLADAPNHDGWCYGQNETCARVPTLPFANGWVHFKAGEALVRHGLAEQRFVGGTGGPETGWWEFRLTVNGRARHACMYPQPVA